MSDTPTEPAAADASANEQQFLLRRVYLKDLSFETPVGAQAFLSKVQPKIDQSMATEIKKIDEDIYEVVLKLTIKANIESEVAFLVEVLQAGLFFVKGIEGQNLTRIFNTTCPQILFPYARETIDSTLVKGSFPPLMLQPINFDAVFAQAIKDQAEKEH